MRRLPAIAPVRAPRSGIDLSLATGLTVPLGEVVMRLRDRTVTLRPFILGGRAYAAIDEAPLRIESIAQMASTVGAGYAAAAEVLMDELDIDAHRAMAPGRTCRQDGIAVAVLDRTGERPTRLLRFAIVPIERSTYILSDRGDIDDAVVTDGICSDCPRDAECLHRDLASDVEDMRTEDPIGPALLTAVEDGRGWIAQTADRRTHVVSIDNPEWSFDLAVREYRSGAGRHDLLLAFGGYGAAATTVDLATLRPAGPGWVCESPCEADGVALCVHTRLASAVVRRATEDESIRAA